MIQDSGNRREFETGAVRDIQEGKGRCDLLPLAVIGDLYAKSGLVEIQQILALINRFQITGDTVYLIYALGMFGKAHFNDNWETLILEVSIHFEEGAKKYGVDNWKKGIPVNCYINSAIRHFLKFTRGDEDERHDRAFAWNLICCIWTCINKPELNEYRKEEVSP